MNRKKTKFLSVLLAALLTFQSAGITVQAENDITQFDNVQIEDIKTLDTLNIIDISTGDSAEITPGSDGEEVLSEGTVDGEDTIDSSVEGPLFPGLPESYKLSAKQIEHKHLLSEHSSTLSPYQEEDNTEFYAKGELIYLTDSEEDAQLVAEAFGGILDSYDLGVAAIRLPEDRTVSQAVLCAASDDYNLPAVWPNYYKQLFSTYSDPALSEANDYQWQHAFVGDTYAWEAGYKGQGVKVGVIDSGVLNAHEEFDGRLVQHLSTLNDTAEPSTIDVNGHGTHVSGIIAANLNNGKGGSGIAPDASLYVYGVGDANGTIDSKAEVRAIAASIKDGLDVINLSLGSGRYDGSEAIMLQEAYKSGIAIFAAAGNEATNGKSYPASYDNVCSIAALQQDGKKATYTNYNDSVDLAFPGTGIYSTYNEGSDSYTYMDGTSMACPVAAGVAAVILSGASQIPELAGKTGTARVDALYDVMADNAKKCPSAGTGAGTTWLPSVFNLKAESVAAVPALPTFNMGNKATITSNYLVLNITSDTTLGVDIYYSTNGKSPALKDGKVTNGTLYTGPITVGGAKKVTVKAIAVNILTGKASKVATGTYTFTPNPSGVEIISNEVHKLAPGSSLALKASGTPSYAVSTKVKWSVAPEGKGVTVSSSGKVSVAKTATAGSFTITATAVDKKGNVFNDDSGKPIASTYDIEVITPEASVKSIALAEKKVSVAKGDSKNLAEGIVVTYGDGKPGSASDVAWSSSNKKIATVDKNGVVTGKAPGKVTIKATANDGTGKSASCTVTVLQLATKLKISGSSKLVAGKSITLKASLSPTNVSSKTLEWSVTGTGVTVKNGKVSASKTASGSYTVTAKTTDGSNLSDSIEISIISDAIKKITLPKTMNLFTTDGYFNAPTSKALSPTIEGGDSTAITYTSSAPSVATVDSKGIVHAVASGKTKITCMATDGSNKKAVCTVTVTVPMSSLTIVPAEDNDGIVSVGSTLKLKAQIGNNFGTPQNAKVKWSVPELYKDIISVSASGAVKAKSIGKNVNDSTAGVYAYVMAEAADGSGAVSIYQIAVIRKIVAFAFIKESGYLVPLAMLDNGDFFNVPYNTTISAPKGKNVGFQPTELGGLSCFFLIPEQATTTKVGSQSKTFTTKDGIKVSVKVKLQTGNKSGSQSIIIIRTADDRLFSM